MENMYVCVCVCVCVWVSFLLGSLSTYISINQSLYLSINLRKVTHKHLLRSHGLEDSLFVDGFELVESLRLRNYLLLPHRCTDVRNALIHRFLEL